MISDLLRSGNVAVRQPPDVRGLLYGSLAERIIVTTARREYRANIISRDLFIRASPMDCSNIYLLLLVAVGAFFLAFCVADEG